MYTTNPDEIIGCAKRAARSSLLSVRASITVWESSAPAARARCPTSTRRPAL